MFLLQVRSRDRHKKEAHGQANQRNTKTQKQKHTNYKKEIQKQKNTRTKRKHKHASTGTHENKAAKHTHTTTKTCKRTTSRRLLYHVLHLDPRSFAFNFCCSIDVPPCCCVLRTRVRNAKKRCNVAVRFLTFASSSCYAD